MIPSEPCEVPREVTESAESADESAAPEAAAPQELADTLATATQTESDNQARAAPPASLPAAQAAPPARQPDRQCPVGARYAEFVALHRASWAGGAGNARRRWLPEELAVVDVPLDANVPARRADVAEALERFDLDWTSISTRSILALVLKLDASQTE